MKVVTTISDVRAITGLAHKAGETVGFVPTMGALHDGHRSLMKAARSECGSVGVSVFVNPTQFGPGEDFDTYPCALAADEAICKAENVDWLFAPSVSEMFPDSARTTVHVSGLTEVLCGLTRPGHFDGVTTVVAKLFSICGPGRAYFGRKDAQQLAVVRQMVKDLNLPIAVIGCPTVREVSVSASTTSTYSTCAIGSEVIISVSVLATALGDLSPATIWSRTCRRARGITVAA